MTEVTPDSVRSYLDERIRDWQAKRVESSAASARARRDAPDVATLMATKAQMASHYVDAYQAMRVEFFGDRLSFPAKEESA